MKVGLTGGIGSGKSAVARLLVEHGALVVDADAVAREVVAPGSAGLAQIADRFGDGVLTARGELDRRDARGAHDLHDLAAARRARAALAGARRAGRSARLSGG